MANSFNILLYYHIQLYGTLGLEIMYTVMGLYGWYYWLHHSSVQITFSALNKKITGLIIISGLLFPPLSFWVFNQPIDYLESIAITFALSAQWMTCYKIVHCWWFWLISNMIYSKIFFDKALLFHCALFIVYAGMAILGLRTWHKQHHVVLRPTN